MESSQQGSGGQENSRNRKETGIKNGPDENKLKKTFTKQLKGFHATNEVKGTIIELLLKLQFTSLFDLDEKIIFGDNFNSDDLKHGAKISLERYVRQYKQVHLPRSLVGTEVTSSENLGYIQKAIGDPIVLPDAEKIHQYTQLGKEIVAIPGENLKSFVEWKLPSNLDLAKKVQALSCLGICHARLPPGVETGDFMEMARCPALDLLTDSDGGHGGDMREQKEKGPSSTADESERNFSEGTHWSQAFMKPKETFHQETHAYSHEKFNSFFRNCKGNLRMAGGYGPFKGFVSAAFQDSKSTIKKGSDLRVVTKVTATAYDVLLDPSLLKVKKKVEAEFSSVANNKDGEKGQRRDEVMALYAKYGYFVITGASLGVQGQGRMESKASEHMNASSFATAVQVGASYQGIVGDFAIGGGVELGNESKKQAEKLSKNLMISVRGAPCAPSLKNLANIAKFAGEPVNWCLLDIFEVTPITEFLRDRGLGAKLEDIVSKKDLTPSGVDSSNAMVTYIKEVIKGPRGITCSSTFDKCKTSKGWLGSSWYWRPDGRNDGHGGGNDFYQYDLGFVRTVTGVHVQGPGNSDPYLVKTMQIEVGNSTDELHDVSGTPFQAFSDVDLLENMEFDRALKQGDLIFLKHTKGYLSFFGNHWVTFKDTNQPSYEQQWRVKSISSNKLAGKLDIELENVHSQSSLNGCFDNTVVLDDSRHVTWIVEKKEFCFNQHIKLTQDWGSYGLYGIARKDSSDNYAILKNTEGDWANMQIQHVQDVKEKMTDSGKTKSIKFREPQKCRHVRLTPLEFIGYKAMRTAVIVQKVNIPSNACESPRIAKFCVNGADGKSSVEASYTAETKNSDRWWKQEFNSLTHVVGIRVNGKGDERPNNVDVDISIDGVDYERVAYNVTLPSSNYVHSFDALGKKAIHVRIHFKGQTIGFKKCSADCSVIVLE